MDRGFRGKYLEEGVSSFVYNPAPMLDVFIRGILEFVCAPDTAAVFPYPYAYVRNERPDVWI